MLVGIISAFVAYYVIFYKSDAKIKGNDGERIVRKKLNQLNKSKYTVLNDVAFNIKGKISQIDHVVVSDYGIFVIETKNYKGVIVGSDRSQTWTQKIYKYKNQFYNPIKQNQGHIYALNYFLKERDLNAYQSIIVFTDRGSLKVKSKTPVIYPSRLKKEIASYRTVIYSRDTKSKIISTIEKYNINA